MNTHRRLTPSRRLVLVDIENIVGGRINYSGAAMWARKTLHSKLRLTHEDLVIVATSYDQDLFNVYRDWPGPRGIFRSGEDGADLALLAELDDTKYLARFDEIVLVSGDHIFLDRVVELGQLGIRVTVVAPRGCLAKRLRMAAATVVTLDHTYTTVIMKPETA